MCITFALISQHYLVFQLSALKELRHENVIQIYEVRKVSEESILFFMGMKTNALISYCDLTIGTYTF